VRRTHLVEGILIGLVVAMLVATAGLAGPSPGATAGNVRALVSYNPAPGNRFHAPISSMGLGGLDEDHPDYIARVPLNLNPPATPGAPSGSSAMASVDVNAMRFIADGSYIPQSETTLGVTTSGGTTYVLGGVNDARFFFCSALPASDCPSARGTRSPSGSPRSSIARRRSTT